MVGKKKSKIYDVEVTGKADPSYYNLTGGNGEKIAGKGTGLGVKGQPILML